jgi:hypothetical protein
VTDLSGLQEQLQDTAAAIARTQRAILEHPDYAELRLSLKSLEKRHRRLQFEFNELVASLGQDVCAYRLTSEVGKYALESIAKSWLHFQDIVSVVYSAIAGEGPKQRGRVSADAKRATAFDVGYVFAGSIGVALTLPNEALMLGLSKIDVAMETAFELARAKTPEEFARFANRLGPAPLRALYKWAKDQTEDQLGVDVEWRRAQATRGKLYLQPQEFKRIRDILESPGTTKVVVRDVIGKVIGADHGKQTFHLKVADFGEITGHSETGAVPEVFTIGKWFKFKLEVRTTPIYSSDEDKTEYVLLASPIPMPSPKAEP